MSERAGADPAGHPCWLELLAFISKTADYAQFFKIIRIHFNAEKPPCQGLIRHRTQYSPTYSDKLGPPGPGGPARGPPRRGLAHFLPPPAGPTKRPVKLLNFLWKLWKTPVPQRLRSGGGRKCSCKPERREERSVTYPPLHLLLFHSSTTARSEKGRRTPLVSMYVSCPLPSRATMSPGRAMSRAYRMASARS